MMKKALSEGAGSYYYVGFLASTELNSIYNTLIRQGKRMMSKLILQ